MIRPATIDDAPAIARVHVEASRTAYRGLMPDAHLATQMTEEKRTAAWRDILSNNLGTTLVAIREDELCGWIAFGPSRDEDGAGRIELAALYIFSKFWRQGIGRELVAAAEAELPPGSLLTLWVLEQNRRAIAFYENCGFLPDGVAGTASISGSALPTIRMAKALSRTSPREG